MPYDPLKDFTAVALNATNYLAVVANPNAQFKNAAEMIAWCKANPGKLTLGTNGEGGYPHLAFELLASMAGFKFLHVPYKGATQVATDVISGQVTVGIGSYSSLSTLVQSGRMRLIGVTNNARVPDKPDLPVFSDLVPGYDMRGWFGYIAPAGTPRAIVKRLNEEINRAMQQPKSTPSWLRRGFTSPTSRPSSTPSSSKRNMPSTARSCATSALNRNRRQ